MSARSSIGLLVLALVACNSRKSDAPPAPSGETAAPPAEVAQPQAAAEKQDAQAVEEGPPVIVSWRLVPTRTEGALVLVDASGTRSEVFHGDLPLDCTAQPARGTLLAAECKGADRTLRISARQAGQEIEIASLAGAGKKAEVLKRIALPAGVRAVRAQTSPTDAAKAGELLIGWAFTPYRDVHVRVERTSPTPASAEQFVAELVGCPAEAPPPAQDVAQATLVCQHRGQTATLSVRRVPGAVTVAHTISGEGLEQHKVEELVVPVPAADAPAGAQ